MNFVYSLEDGVGVDLSQVVGSSEPLITTVFGEPEKQQLVRLMLRSGHTYEVCTSRADMEKFTKFFKKMRPEFFREYHETV